MTHKIANVYLDWMAGDSLVPGWSKYAEDPVCDTQRCLDPSRIVIVSFFAHFLQLWLCHAIMQRYRPYRTYSFHDKLYMLSSLVSTVHAIVCLNAVAEVVINRKTIFQNTLLFARSARFEAYVAYSVGYFFYDLVLMHLPNSFWSPSFFLHHIMAAFGLPLLFVFKQCMFIAVVFLFYELSTPFVNGRWLLDKFGLRHSSVYKVNGILMVLTFFFARLVPAQPILLTMVYNRRDEFVAIHGWLFNVIITVWILSTLLNIYWMYKMVMGALKVLQNKPAGDAKTKTKEKKDQ